MSVHKETSNNHGSFKIGFCHNHGQPYGGMCSVDIAFEYLIMFCYWIRKQLL